MSSMAERPSAERDQSGCVVGPLGDSPSHRGPDQCERLLRAREGRSLGGHLLAAEPPEAAPRAGALVSKKTWLGLGALALVSFLLTLDDTALSVALPSVGRDLGLGLSGLEWVVNAYTLALAALLLAGGRLADALGARRVFLIGLAVFTLASLAAGLAPSGVLLLAARGLQGAGAALIMPASLAIIHAGFPERRRGLAVGVWAGVSAAGLAIGPLLGAALTGSFGWGSIFLVNVPVGVLALAAGRVILAKSKPAARRRRFDLAGMLTSAVTLVALVFALTEGMSYGWRSPLVLASFAAAAVGLVAFVTVERCRQAPLLELGLFRSRNLSGANAVSLLSTAVMCGIFFFISLYLQIVRGDSAIEAGLMFLPMTLLICLVAPVAGRISDRLGRRWPAATGMLILAAGLWLLSGLGAKSGLAALLPGLIVAGVGIGLTTAPVTTAALDFAPPEEAGVRAGILNTSRMVGLAVGITLMGAIVTARWPGGLAGAATDPRAFVDGLSVAFEVNAGIALIAATLAALTIAGGRRARVRRPYRGMEHGRDAEGALARAAAPAS